MATASRMVFNVLIKKDEDTGIWLAHCLELDIVAEGEGKKQVEDDLLDLVMAQFDYAMVHDNMDHFYRPAPQDVWREFFGCQLREELERKFESRLGLKEAGPESFVTTTCSPDEFRYAAG